MIERITDSCHRASRVPDLTCLLYIVGGRVHTIVLQLLPYHMQGSVLSQRDSRVVGRRDTKGAALA